MQARTMKATASPDTTITNLVLFFCAARTGHFGQGTFVQTVLDFVKKQHNIKVTIIKTDLQENITEVTYQSDNNIDYLLIPSPQNGITVRGWEGIVQETYARRIIDISANYLSEKENLIFWVNSVDYLNIAKELRNRLTGIHIVYVHHAWSWKHFLNISDEKFGKKLLTENNALHPKEWVYYQQEMTTVADRVITVTDHAKYFFEKFLAVPPAKITAIHNGIDPDSIKVYDKNAIRKKYGFRNEEKIILYSGRITAEKGLPFALKAFSLLAAKREDVRLLIAGNGSIPEYIPLAAPYWSRVIYTGELSKEQIYELYSIADIGVQPSLIEQCSFTAIEMCLHKIPLVVSSDIGLDEMFEDEQDALKVKVCYDEEGIKYLDHNEIAEKIEQLLLQPDKAAQLGANAFVKASRRFNISKMGDAYLEIFNQLSSTYANH